jgi:hypothetical protein
VAGAEHHFDEAADVGGEFAGDVGETPARSGWVRGFAEAEGDEEYDEEDHAGGEDEAVAEADFGGEVEDASATDAGAGVGAGEHHAVGQAAFAVGEGGDGECIDGDVLGGGEDIVEEDDGGEKFEVSGEVDGHGDEEGEGHDELASENPAAAPAEFVRVEDVDKWAEEKFPGPGEVEGGDESADLGDVKATLAHFDGDGGGGEAEWDSFGEVEEEEGGEAAPLGGEDVPHWSCECSVSWGESR